MANPIVGALKAVGILQNAFFEGESYGDLLNDIASRFQIELEADAVTNMVVSNQQPSDSQRKYVWYALNSDGAFYGMFVYGGGGWNQITPIPNGIFRMYGDSTNLPKGFALADQTNVNLDAEQVNALQQGWVENGLGGYKIFDCTFAGF